MKYSWPGQITRKGVIDVSKKETAAAIIKNAGKHGIPLKKKKKPKK